MDVTVRLLTFMVLVLECYGGDNREALEVYVDHHAHGGVRQRGIFDVQACIEKCVGNCMAVDFNEKDSSCWHHYSESICNALQEKAGCRHYKFVTCDGGEHLPSGVLQPEIRDPTTCVNSCWDEKHCGGVDFNSRFKSCWFHDYETICGTKVKKESCNHIRLRPSVCAADFPGYHAFGGTLQRGIRDEKTCLSSCRNGCQAADFDSNGNTCYHHTNETACTQPNIKPSCTHFKFVDCATTTSTTTTPPPTTTTTTPPPTSPTTTLPPTSTTQTPQMEESTIPDLSSPVTTIEPRDIFTDCLAMDFNYQLSTCWFHFGEAACSELRRKADCVHIKLLDCACFRDHHH